MHWNILLRPIPFRTTVHPHPCCQLVHTGRIGFKISGNKIGRKRYLQTSKSISLKQSLNGPCSHWLRTTPTLIYMEVLLIQINTSEMIHVRWTKTFSGLSVHKEPVKTASTFHTTWCQQVALHMAFVYLLSMEKNGIHIKQSKMWVVWGVERTEIWIGERHVQTSVWRSHSVVPVSRFLLLNAA